MSPERIKQIREELELTPDEFGKILSVTRPSVVRYENGSIKPQGDAERRLRCLDVSLNDPQQTDTIKKLLGTTSSRTKFAAKMAAGVASLVVGLGLRFRRTPLPVREILIGTVAGTIVHDLSKEASKSVKNAGVTTLSSLLGLSSATQTDEGNSVSLLDLIKSPAGSYLYDFLKKFHA
jgi:predicted transcriptional regulator